MKTSCSYLLFIFSVSLIGNIAISNLANAFGTIRGMGQDAEHGRITRRALTCADNQDSVTCFESKTLTSLAGDHGSFGAVGAPDRGRGMLTSYAHCSGGDFFDIPGYPQTSLEAQLKLNECHEHMRENLVHAVLDAADLIDEKGRVRSSQLPGIVGCTYVGSEHGRAKCNILAHFGRIIHAAQDFYSHSNWVDKTDSKRAIGIENPPGLGNLGKAPWLSLRDSTIAFPQGLISGCFDTKSFESEEAGCTYGTQGGHRVRHLDLAKDTGPIDPAIGSGTTNRGAIEDNFQRAVEASIDDTKDKWMLLREKIIETYGTKKGGTMICAITHDNPVDQCH